MLRISQMISPLHIRRRPAQPSPSFPTSSLLTSPAQPSPCFPTSSLCFKLRPSTFSLCCTAMHRPQYRTIRFLSIEELLMDPNKTDRLKEFGEFALKVALIGHLFTRYPAQLVTELSEANMSRENLTRVAERLESAGLIYLMDVKDGQKDSAKEYVVGVIGGVIGFSAHKFWEAVMNQHKETGKVKEIKQALMKEVGKGFKAGLYNYALQVAGIIYFESKYDTQTFWERFNKYMEPIVIPQDLESRSAAAKEFELDLEGVIEDVPLFQSVMLTWKP